MRNLVYFCQYYVLVAETIVISFSVQDIAQLYFADRFYFFVHAHQTRDKIIFHFLFIMMEVYTMWSYDLVLMPT